MIPDTHSQVLNVSGWKRIAFMVGLALTVLILMLSWWMRDPDDAFIAWVYPAFALICTLLIIPVLTRSVPQAQLEVASYTLITALILSRLVWHFHFGGPIEEHLLPLVGGHYWSLGAMIVASAVLFDRYRGLTVGLSVLALAILIALTGLAGELGSGAVSSETIGYLIRVHLFIAVLLALASVMTIVRGNHQRTLIRAELFSQWANTDALTEVPNRRAAYNFLRARVGEAMRYKRPLSVILLDLDNFKLINDTWGHGRGDEVLVRAAARLSAHLRESDFLARWGGEEFLIVAPETASDEACELAERCRRGLADRPIDDIAVSATFGISELADGDTVESLVSRADAMMYQGKTGGRNQVAVAAV